MAGDDAMPDFAALAAKARMIAEAAQRRPAPGAAHAAERSTLLDADAAWGAGVAPDGTRYFFDKATGHTQWHEPPALQGAGLRVVLGEFLPGGPTLPAPWRELKDADTGRSYYWDAATGETRWERPLPASVAEATIISARPDPGDDDAGDEVTFAEHETRA